MFSLYKDVGLNNVAQLRADSYNAIGDKQTTYTRYFDEHINNILNIICIEDKVCMDVYKFIYNYNLFVCF